MNMFSKKMGIWAVLATGMLFAGIASATTVMNFDQLNANGEYVNSYYDGGCGGSYNGGAVTCNGPNDGVEWVNAVAGYAPGGLYGNTANEPSNRGVMGIVGGSVPDAYMNVASGFTGSFSFFYAAAQVPAAINVYSGLSGAGTLLATLSLPLTGDGCDGFSEDYSCWNPLGVSFSGIARSVDFSGAAYGIVFDNVTLESATPSVPEPAALGMFGLGILLIGGFLGLRRRMA